MNPLDLPGPAFLLFYATMATVVLGLAWWQRSRHEEPAAPADERWTWRAILPEAGAAGDPARADVSDPYFIAYVRGGSNEALRVATAVLFDRGLVIPSGEDGLVAVEGARAIVTRPIERELLKWLETPRKAGDMFSETRLTGTCDAYYTPRLVAAGFLPGPAQASRRARLLLIAALLLAGVSAAKIAVAAARGRYNVGFLIVLTLASLVAAVVVTHPRLTTAGRRFVGHVRTLLGGAPRAPRPGSGSAELALHAAAFGLAGLPAATSQPLRKLFPKAASTSGSCGGSCGSSCGASCGGGGGCGGGCGGCGG